MEPIDVDADNATNDFFGAKDAANDFFGANDAANDLATDAATLKTEMETSDDDDRDDHDDSDLGDSKEKSADNGKERGFDQSDESSDESSDSDHSDDSLRRDTQPESSTTPRPQAAPTTTPSRPPSTSMPTRTPLPRPQNRFLPPSGKKRKHEGSTKGKQQDTWSALYSTFGAIPGFAQRTVTADDGSSQVEIKALARFPGVNPKELGEGIVARLHDKTEKLVKAVINNPKFTNGRRELLMKASQYIGMTKSAIGTPSNHRIWKMATVQPDISLMLLLHYHYGDLSSSSAILKVFRKAYPDGVPADGNITPPFFLKYPDVCPPIDEASERHKLTPEGRAAAKEADRLAEHLAELTRQATEKEAIRQQAIDTLASTEDLPGTAAKLHKAQRLLAASRQEIETIDASIAKLQTTFDNKVAVLAKQRETDEKSLQQRHENVMVQIKTRETEVQRHIARLTQLTTGN